MKPLVKCDNCGRRNPETFTDSKLTKCCSTYDKKNSLAFYQTKDEQGTEVYSSGKLYFYGLQGKERS